MKRIAMLLSAICVLSGCASIISGDYAPPQSGPIAYLTVDNTKIASPGRTIRIIGMTTSGCVGSPFITADKFATSTGGNVYRVAIPAGSKIVLESNERIDQSNGTTDWYGSVSFEAEAGAEYNFYSYVKMPAAEHIRTNQAPEVMVKAVEMAAQKNNEGKAAMLGVFKVSNGKELWVKPNKDKTLPKEQSYGYCPAK